MCILIRRTALIKLKLSKNLEQLNSSEREILQDFLLQLHTDHLAAAPTLRQVLIKFNPLPLSCRIDSYLHSYSVP